MSLVVPTTAGRLAGSLEPPGAVFRGIPFAAPPLAALRFAAPQPLFTWRSPLHGGEMGSCHALDLPFTFGTLDASGMPAFVGDESAPQNVSEVMRAAWTSFARSGVPSCDPVGAWPGYDEGRRATVELCDPPRLLEDPFSCEREILESVDFEPFT